MHVCMHARTHVCMYACIYVSLYTYYIPVSIRGPLRELSVANHETLSLCISLCQVAQCIAKCRQGALRPVKFRRNVRTSNDQSPWMKGPVSTLDLHFLWKKIDTSFS